LLTHVIKQCLIAPWHLGHQMMERLPSGLNVMRVESRRHRLDALPFAGQQQTLAIVFERPMPIFVPRGARQSSINAAKRFPGGPGAERRDPTKQFRTILFFYDPVVLVDLHKLEGPSSASFIANRFLDASDDQQESVLGSWSAVEICDPVFAEAVEEVAARAEKPSLKNAAIQYLERARNARRIE